MKKITLLTVCVLTLASIGCKSTSKASLATNSNSAMTETTVYGSDFIASKVVKYDDLLKSLSKTDKVEDVVVEGSVNGVCQAKGCWMNIVSEKDTQAPKMFVKFKDYAFFMPLDLEGKVIMKGYAYKEETSVDELRHYAEDEGKSKEEIAKITKPVTEYKFMASGVKIFASK
jgi:hypothetical protein